jgi:hypothetical protein
MTLSFATFVVVGEVRKVVAQGADVPRTNLLPIGPSTSPSFGQTSPLSGGFVPSPGPSFDPYAGTNGSFGSTALGGNNFGGPTLGAPQINSAPPFGSAPAYSGPAAGFGTPQSPFAGGGGILGGLFTRPASQPDYSSPMFNAPSISGTYPSTQGAYPGGFDNPSVYGPSNSFGSPSGSLFPEAAYPSSAPTTLFPGGLFGNGTLLGSGLGGGTQAFRGPRLRHGYIGSGGGPMDLNVHNTDVSMVFAIPNFMSGTQPLYVIPSFSLHQFDGPQSSTGADLPSATYDGFLDIGYNTDPNQMLGTELGVRVGAFTDFDHFTSDSLRVLGKGLVNFRITPMTTLKGGVYYVDRLKWKVIPAGGILWQPNPYTRFDLFFPQPKLARYFRTLGTKDVWWYLAGDFGGGSWTIRRDDESSDQVDLNEMLAIGGFEWGYSDLIRAGQRTAFAEIGYAFNRELIYGRDQDREFELDDGIMFRVGFGY